MYLPHWHLIIKTAVSECMAGASMACIHNESPIKSLWMHGCKVDHKYEFKSVIGNNYYNYYVSWQIIGITIDVMSLICSSNNDEWLLIA